MKDVPLATAMLCWNHGFRGNKPGFAVVPWPDERGLSDPYQSSVGACFGDFRRLDAQGQKLQMLIDAWHIVTFYEVPIEIVSEGMLAIPEYRSTLAYDCLPERYRHERDD